MSPLKKIKTKTTKLSWGRSVLDDQLYTCVIKKLFDIADILIEMGANIHFEDDQLLWTTCSNGELEMTKYLLSRGADPFLGLPVKKVNLNKFPGIYNERIKEILVAARKEVLCQPR